MRSRKKLGIFYSSFSLLLKIKNGDVMLSFMKLMFINSKYKKKVYMIGENIVRKFTRGTP
jgi:hypothetical protein